MSFHIYCHHSSLRKVSPAVNWTAAVCVHECTHACSVVSDSFVTPWTVACQAPLSMGFPRQAYRSEM